MFCNVMCGLVAISKIILLKIISFRIGFPRNCAFYSVNTLYRYKNTASLTNLYCCKCSARLLEKGSPVLDVNLARISENDFLA